MFVKQKGPLLPLTIETFLNMLGHEVIICDRSSCRILHANDQALKRLGPNVKLPASCQDSYADGFDSLCENCPGKNGTGAIADAQAEMRDYKLRLHNIDYHPFLFGDGLDAVAIFARNSQAQADERDRLMKLAFIDPLTEAPNRRKFIEDMEALSVEIDEGKTTGMIALFDLDNFKVVNDTYGHNVGDMMLKRLVSHITSIRPLANSLYRLGGDEFVLLFHTQTEEATEYERYCLSLLEGILMAYTLPNIEEECTISVGVAAFPRQGRTVSELLRKADIAMYNAKVAGKNRMSVFEEAYDSAKKFVDVFVNVTPVLNEYGTTVSYELIDNSPQPDEESDDAALEMLDFDRTVETLGLKNLDGTARYYISFNKQLFAPAVIKNLPKDSFIIQVGEQGSYAKSLIPSYKALVESGFTLALDNFSPLSSNEKVVEMADILKVDFDKFGEDEHSAITQRFRSKQLVAKNINTPEDFARAKGYGYKFFQGYYFSVPITKVAKEMEPIRANYLRLLDLCTRGGFVDFKAISAVIEADVALSYKILKLINSVAMGLRYKATSIDLAVAYLGEEHLKRWVALLALRGVSDQKPLEIVRLSIIRARFGELLAPKLSPVKKEKQMFLLGLFSLLNVAMNRPFEDVFKDISVAEDIQDALTHDKGRYAGIIEFYRDYEYGNWEGVVKFVRQQELDSEFVQSAYLEAVQWYNEISADIK